MIYQLCKQICVNYCSSFLCFMLGLGLVLLFSIGCNAQDSLQNFQHIQGKYSNVEDTCNFYLFHDNHFVSFNLSCAASSHSTKCGDRNFDGKGPFLIVQNPGSENKPNEQILSLYQDDSLLCQVLSVTTLDSNHIIITSLKGGPYEGREDRFLYTYPIVYRKEKEHSSESVDLSHLLKDKINLKIEISDSARVNGRDRFYIGFSDTQSCDKTSPRSLIINERKVEATFPLELIDFCQHNLDLNIKFPYGSLEKIPVFNTGAYARMWRMTREERIQYKSDNPEIFYHDKFIARMGLNSSYKTNIEIFGNDFEGQTWYIQLMTLEQFYNTE